MIVNALRFRVWVFLIACCASFCWLTTGCDSCDSKEKKPDETQGAESEEELEGIPITLRLSDAEQAKANKLKRKIRRGRFSKRVVKRKKNAKLFLYLAAKSDDPKVIAASLEAMRTAYASKGSKRGRPRANDDYGLVVATHLESSNPKVQGVAILASHHVVRGRKPYRPVIDALVSVAESHSSPGARVEALEALQRVRNYWKNRAIASALLRNLEGQAPAVLSTALLLSYRKGTKGLTRKNEFLTKARALLKHKDPAVRGRAARLAATLGKGDEKLLDEISPLLQDQHPFTRLVAAAALRELEDVRAVHRLVPVVDDMATTSYKIPYRTLRGRRSNVKHGSKGTTVHDRVVEAIAKLSATTEWPLEPAPVDKKDREGSREKNAAAAKAWYAKHRAQLPKDKPARPPSEQQPPSEEPP